MDRTQEILYGATGQEIEFYPPEWNAGIPSSATCQVFAGEIALSGTAEFSPTVTIDSFSTTVDALSGPTQAQPGKLNLAATTGGAVGRFYLAENEDHGRELVTPRLINDGDSFVLENDLVFDYASGASATLKGLRMVFTVDATWVATESKIRQPGRPPYKAVFSYTVASIPRRHYLYLRLVRQKFKSGVTIRDLQALWSDLPLEEPRSARGRGHVDLITAAEDFFRKDLEAISLEPSQIRDTQASDMAVILKALHLVPLFRGAAPGGWTVPEFEALARKEYEVHFHKHFGNLKVPVDLGTQGVATDKRAVPRNTWFSR